jgi:streptogramin lyase
MTKTCEGHSKAEGGVPDDARSHGDDSLGSSDGPSTDSDAAGNDSFDAGVDGREEADSASDVAVNADGPAVCGDKIKQPPEECDQGTGNNTGGYNGCNPNCTLGPRCGDGATNGTEACDNGPANGTFIGECRLDCSGIIDVTEFDLKYVNSKPSGIVTGPDDNLWFTESKGNRIGQMTTRGNLLKEISVSSGSDPGGIVVGPDGNLWFSERSGSGIANVAVGAITAYEYTVPKVPGDLVTGSDNAIWFVETGAMIGRLTTDFTFSEYSGCVSGTCELYGIASAGGKIWFADGHQGQIRSMTTAGTELREYQPPSFGSGTYDLTLGPDGNLWFTEYTTNKVCSMTLSGNFGSEFPLSAGSGPRAIASGPDGNVWFVEVDGNRIGRVTPKGKVDEAPIPTAASAPDGITSGPDGNVWFVEGLGNKIARVNIKKP